MMPPTKTWMGVLADQFRSSLGERLALEGIQRSLVEDTRLMLTSAA